MISVLSGKGIVGCFLLDDQAAGQKCLNDESHEVRAMAAWLLVRTGEKEQGVACFEKLLRAESYAILKLLNIVDWMGDDAKLLIPALKDLQFTSENIAGDKDAERIRQYKVDMFQTLQSKLGFEPNN